MRYRLSVVKLHWSGLVIPYIGDHLVIPVITDLVVGSTTQHHNYYIAMKIDTMMIVVVCFTRQRARKRPRSKNVEA